MAWFFGKKNFRKQMVEWFVNLKKGFLAFGELNVEN